jgi:cytochrome c-type biogenesis protein CcmF
MGIAFTLYARRAGELAKPAGFSAISRESLLVWNNFGLAVAAAVVLIGTLYPLFVEAFGGGLISVGPPFFNATVAPLLCVLFVLLPVAPLLAWRSGDIKAAFRQLAPAALIALATLAAALWFTHGRIWPALGLGLGAWLIAGGFIYLYVRAKRGGSFKILALPLAVWSMSLAHIGAGVLTLGAIAETAFRSERAATMRPGDSLDFAGRSLTLSNIEQTEGPNYYATRASFSVTRGDETQSLSAERRFYPTSPAPTTEVGILSGPEGDFYVALGDVVRDGAQNPGWAVRVYSNPLLQFIFWGVALMGLGGALSLVALARKRIKEGAA